MGEDATKIIRRYAEACKEIYDNKTAGEFTWEGLLYSMLVDLEVII